VTVRVEQRPVERNTAVGKELEAPDSLPISWCELAEDIMTAPTKRKLEDILAIKHIQRFLAELPRYKKDDWVSFGVQGVILIRPLVAVEDVGLQFNELPSGKEIAIDL